MKTLPVNNFCKKNASLGKNSAQYSWPPRQIFGRQDHYSGGHNPGEQPLPTARSLLQNLGKTLVLAVLPPGAALVFY